MGLLTNEATSVHLAKATVVGQEYNNSEDPQEA